MSLFEASRYVARIELIDLGALWQEGVRFLLIDRDNTCMARSTMRVEPPVAAWFAKAHEIGFATCLVSNNFHGDQVAASARRSAKRGCGSGLKSCLTSKKEAYAQVCFFCVLGQYGATSEISRCSPSGPRNITILMP